MVITMQPAATETQIRAICDFLAGYNSANYAYMQEAKEQLAGAVNAGKDLTLINVLGYTPDKQRLIDKLLFFEGIEEIRVVKKYSLVSKEFTQNRPVVVGRDFPSGRREVVLNGSEFAIMAGPCAVESAEQIEEIARFVSSMGLSIMRAGAYKPRTYPSSFQGLRKNGLHILRKAADKYRLLIVSEMTEASQAEHFKKYVDLIQIGTRNMHNFELLKAAGRIGLPVLLKRGLSATIDELLGAAEHILSEQARNGHKQQVVICLRGIRTFDCELMRNTPDLATIAALKKSKTGLAIIFDPSHSTGDRELVLANSKMAAVGMANGLLVEIHPNPSEALVDGPQSLNFAQFEDLLEKLRPLCTLENRVIT